MYVFGRAVDLDALRARTRFWLITNGRFSQDALRFGLGMRLHLLGWDVPDVLIYPTGGGTGIVGIWKAFDEMEALGWIGSQRPRMICVQSAGCAPIVRAFEQGVELAEPWQNAATIADGLRVPAAIGDFLILRALRQSGGTALSLSDDELRSAQREIGRLEGMFVAPEAAATLAGLRHLVERGAVQPHERVVLLVTGNGLKYTHLDTE